MPRSLGAILLLHVSGAVAAEAVKAQVKVHAMQSLTEADNERTVDLRVGERSPDPAGERDHRLPLDGRPLRSGVVDPAGSEPHYAGGAVGSAGNVTFDFTAKKAGNGGVALKYWRHFEGEGSVVKRFRIRLNAQ